jgi:hypothetical protein
MGSELSPAEGPSDEFCAPLSFQRPATSRRAFLAIPVTLANDMDNKREYVAQRGAEINRLVEETFGLHPDTDEATKLMRACMEPKQLLTYNLALFYEQEMMRAAEANAYFAACLQGAAMNEAFLCLMCQIHKDDVKTTPQYRHSTRRGRVRSYSELVENWTLEHFANIACQLDWIPASAITSMTRETLGKMVRTFASAPINNLTSAELGALVNDCEQHPASAMFHLTQEMRNRVHAGRWLREADDLHPELFSTWCHVGARLCCEIRDCLMKSLSDHAVMQLDKAVSQLPKDWRPA